MTECCYVVIYPFGLLNRTQLFPTIEAFFPPCLWMTKVYLSVRGWEGPPHRNFTFFYEKTMQLHIMLYHFYLGVRVQKLDKL